MVEILPLLPPLPHPPAHREWSGVDRRLVAEGGGMVVVAIESQKSEKQDSMKSNDEEH